MLFRDLVVCNKDWEETTGLILISKGESDSIPMAARAARSIFGERQVLWFRDCVVMLL